LDAERNPMRLRCYHDQTIAEILTDSVTKMMMEADGIDARELETALRLVARSSPAVSSRQLRAWLTRRR
jgi:hypothetical protein